jgi:23S rRNA pseudouridine1911/1915/1917 synthase
MPAYSGVVEGALPDTLRLDRYVAEHLKLLSRSQIRAKNLVARLNGKPVKLSRAVKSGDTLELTWEEAEPSLLIPEDLPLDVLYEDDRVVVVNKAQGMVVHPGAGNHSGTLANALLFRRLGRGQAGTGFRPGIVHRLDKDTSGVIIAAYDDEALTFLADQFKNRSVRKTYAALVRGHPPAARGCIETRLGRDLRDRKRFAVTETTGKAAVTLYRLIKTWEGYSFLLLRPRTGRTHQIRVHLKHLGCPILGDPVYGKPDPRFSNAALMLHANRLSLVLPGGEPRTFTAPIPPRFRDVWKNLNG